MTSKCFTHIQTASVPSTRCLLCPSMDLIAVAGERLLIQRTVSWQRVASSDKVSHALCWSPDGTILAVAPSEGGFALYDVELGMTDSEERFVFQQNVAPKLKDLVWVHVGRPHPGWILTDEEKERELEWKYRSAYLDRSLAFLPPSSYNLNDTEPEGRDVARKSHPTSKKPLSILCAVTSDDSIYLYVHGRYHVATMHCSRVCQVVCSNDIAHVSVMQSPSILSVYYVPALVKHRYSLQIVSALFSSIQGHVNTISEGVPSILSSWRNSLRQLDVKIDALQGILRSYGVESKPSSVLLDHIILGKTSDYANALEQFFAGVQMNDQLLLRMEKTLHNGLAGVEASARANLLAPARSLAFDANELCGLDDELLPQFEDMCLCTRTLLFSIEFLLTQIVDARFRLRDFCAWLRSTAAEIKAKDTPPNSVQHENARKRRVSEQLLRRVADCFQDDLNWTNDQGPTEDVICCCVSALLSGKNAHVSRVTNNADSPHSVKTSLFDPAGIPTVSSALGYVQECMMTCFEQPRRFVQQGILKTDINLPSGIISKSAVHARIGVEVSSLDDNGHLEGAFFPLTSSEEQAYSNSRRWTILARSMLMKSGHCGVQLILIPVGSNYSWVLSRCLMLPSNVVIHELGFYGDDGKSTRLHANDAIGEGKEGRQALGLLVENGINLELWLVPYDFVVFDVTKTSRDGDLVDARGLEMMTESFVQVLPRTQDSMLDDIADPGKLYAKSKTISLRQLRSCGNLCLTHHALARPLPLSADEVAECRLLLSGSRGLGGVVARNRGQASCLLLFDLEEDDEVEENDDMEQG